MANKTGKKRAKNARLPRPKKQEEMVDGIPKSLLLEYPKSVAEAFAPLTVLQRKFVQFYCGECNGNATLAAEMAGDKNAEPGTKSYIALASVGSAYLRNPLIRKAVDAWMQAFALSAAEVTHRFMKMADVNPGPFFEIVPIEGDTPDQVVQGGRLQLKGRINRQDWEAFKHWIREVEIDPKGNVISVKLHDGQVALDRVAKILKLYTDQPIFAFNLYVQQLPDTDLLKEIELARAQELEVIDPTSAGRPALTSGQQPVKVLSGEPDQVGSE